MCRRVQCSECDRPTYAGCGAHIEQVLGDVPIEDRCGCRDQKKRSAAEAPAGAKSWLQKLLER